MIAQSAFLARERVLEAFVKPLRAIAVSVVLALFIGACGGGDDEPENGTGAGNGGVIVPATATASAGPTGGGSTIGDGDIEYVPGALTQLDSFRFEIVIEGDGNIVSGLIPDDSEIEADRVVFNGAWIGPDQSQLEFSLGGFQIKQTIIGGQEWSAFGDLQQGPVVASRSANDLVVIADLLDANESLRQTEYICAGADVINGIQALRCEVSEVARASFVENLTDDNLTVEDATMTLWVAEEGGFIVRSELTATGVDAGNLPFTMRLSANVTDINNVDEIAP